MSNLIVIGKKTMTHKYKTLILSSMLLLLCALTASQSSWAEAVASVDRNKIGLNETFELTISIDSSSFFGGPDLSVLEKDFTIMGRSQNSRISNVNGSMEAVTEWAITLSPTRVGTLTIPPIKVSRERTRAITIEVTQTAPQRGIQGAGQRIFLEAQFDQQEAYVQSQLVYTVRIVSPVELLDKAFETPTVNNALVEPLGESAYSKMINGQRYALYEARFALFPQASGELTVPPVRVEALVPVRRQRSIFNLGGSGRKIELTSAEATLNITEKPAKFPATATWLPAKNLTITEHWSGDTKQLQVGESITRRIVISADGLLGEQLPPSTAIQIDGIKVYPDRPEVTSKAGNHGVTGTRVESFALQATRAGAFHVPEFKIQWWDTAHNRLRVAKLPARTLRVKGAISASQGQTDVAPAITEAVTPGQQERSPTTALTPTATGGTAIPLFWQVLCGCLALGWLVTLLLYWQAKRGKTPSEGKARPVQAPSAAAAFRELENACKQNNPVAARAALIQWAKLFWPDKTIHCAADVQTLSSDPELRQALLSLDKVIYAAGGNQWQGSELLARLKQLQAQQPTRNISNQALPQLY